MKVLLIDDSSDTKVLVSKALEGQMLDWAESCQAGMKMLRDSQYDIILLDIILPDGNGLELIRQLHKEIPGQSKTPVIFLSVKDELDDKVRAFTGGAVDYLVKPFYPVELKLRMESTIRMLEMTRPSSESSEIRRGSILVRLSEHQVVCAHGGREKEIQLTGTEFRLFYLFFKNAGKLVSRDQIMREIWDSNEIKPNRIIDKYISCLRQKLGTTTFLFESVHGKGYKMSVMDEH